MVTVAMVETLQTLQSHRKPTPNDKKEPFHYSLAMSVTTNDTKHRKTLQTSYWEASQERKLESSTNHSILMPPMVYHQGEISYRAGKEKFQDRGQSTATLHRKAEGGSLVPTVNKSIEYRYRNTYRLSLNLACSRPAFRRWKLMFHMCTHTQGKGECWYWLLCSCVQPN